MTGINQAALPGKPKKKRPAQNCSVGLWIYKTALGGGDSMAKTFDGKGRDEFPGGLAFQQLLIY